MIQSTTHVKTYSILLIFRNILIKAIVIYHLAPVTMPIIKQAAIGLEMDSVGEHLPHIRPWV